MVMDEEFLSTTIIPRGGSEGTGSGSGSVLLSLS